MSQEFKGFSQDTQKFFNDLDQNNNKVWFEKNRPEFEKFVLNPLKDLVNDLSFFMQSLDSEIDVTPAINKTISTIYRDTRFSKNKTPLKTFMHLKFKRRRSDWKQNPSFYFDIGMNGYGFGMGFFRADSKTMGKLREVISENPEKFLKIVRKIEKTKMFHVCGDKYKRIFDKNQSEELLNFTQRKNLYLVASFESYDDLLSNKFIQELAEGFEVLHDFYEFLWEVRNEGV